MLLYITIKPLYTGNLSVLSQLYYSAQTTLVNRTCCERSLPSIRRIKRRNAIRLISYRSCQTVLNLRELRKKHGIDNKIETIGFRPQGTDNMVQTTGYKQYGTDNRVQATGYRQQGTDNRVQTTGYRPQGTDNRIQTIWYRQQGSDHRVQTTWYRQQDTNNMVQATGYRQQGTVNRCTFKQRHSTGYRNNSQIEY